MTLTENRSQLPPAHDTIAEESLLSAALKDRDALEVLVAEVSPDDFYDPAHAELAAVMVEMAEDGQPVETRTVAPELDRLGRLERVGGYARLFELVAVEVVPSNASRYARVITEKALSRRILRDALSLARLAGEDGDAITLVEQARSLFADVELPVSGRSLVPSVDMLLMSDDPPYDWEVEGLIERQDRLVITGIEGGGKSTLLRQLAVCIAAGIHPFHHGPIDPRKVLVVDVENSLRQIRRELGPLVDIVKGNRNWDPDNLRVAAKLDVDLLSRHDRDWLVDLVASNRPDVLITGPLYQLFSADPKDEQPAKALARLFDRIRARYGCALILEAHAAKGAKGLPRTLEPYGASLWLRWPEFGYGLRPADAEEAAKERAERVAFQGWRGPRDQRDWPTRLVADPNSPWPWTDPDARPRTMPRGGIVVSSYRQPEFDDRVPSDWDLENGEL